MSIYLLQLSIESSSNFASVLMSLPYSWVIHFLWVISFPRVSIPLSHFILCKCYAPHWVSAAKSIFVVHLVQRSSTSSLPFPILYPTLHLCQSYSFDLSSLYWSYFVSLMRDSSLPSFDKFVLVDLSILSRTQTENIFNTLEFTCLNGGYPHSR